MAGKEAKNAKVKNELGGYIDLAPSSTRSKMNMVSAVSFPVGSSCLSYEDVAWKAGNDQIFLFPNSDKTWTLGMMLFQVQGTE